MIAYFSFYLISLSAIHQLPRLKKLLSLASMANRPQQELSIFRRRCPIQLEVTSTIQDVLIEREMWLLRCPWSSLIRPGRDQGIISLNSHLRDEIHRSITQIKLLTFDAGKEIIFEILYILIAKHAHIST